MVPRNYVLVHDAFLGGWCWHSVATILRQSGHHVTTPTLTGLGERRHLLSGSISLDTFVQDVVEHIRYGRISDAVLVGHGFGGLVIAGVADRIRTRVRELVFLDAVISTTGKSYFESVPPEIRAIFGTASLKAGGLIVPPPAVAHFGLSQDLPAATAAALLTPHPIATMHDPLALANPIGNGLPCTYIACTAQPSPSVAPSREWALSQPDWSFHELKGPHSAMITHPQLTATAIEETSSKTEQPHPLIEREDQRAARRFESLGDNCEFGFYLREIGIEDGGLLRWAISSPTSVLAGLRGEFAGLFQHENLVPHGRGMVIDKQYGFKFHTEIRLSASNLIEMTEYNKKTYEKEKSKFDHLRSKFLERLKGGQTIFVYKVNSGISELECMPIAQELRRLGDGILLIVRLTEDHRLYGKVERQGPYYVGYIDQFAPYGAAKEISTTVWHDIVRNAVAAIGCQSLSGPDADRRDNLLSSGHLVGSLSGACSQAHGPGELGATARPLEDHPGQ